MLTIVNFKCPISLDPHLTWIVNQFVYQSSWINPEEFFNFSFWRLVQFILLQHISLYPSREYFSHPSGRYFIYPPRGYFIYYLGACFVYPASIFQSSSVLNSYWVCHNNFIPGNEWFFTVLPVYWHCAMSHSVTYCHYTGSTVENRSLPEFSK